MCAAAVHAREEVQMDSDSSSLTIAIPTPHTKAADIIAGNEITQHVSAYLDKTLINFERIEKIFHQVRRVWRYKAPKQSQRMWTPSTQLFDNDIYHIFLI